MKISFLALLTGLVAATPANAQTWLFATGAGDPPDRFERWVEPESIERNGTDIRFRVQEISERPSPRGFDRIIILFSADCAARTYRIVEFTAYQPDGANFTSPGRSGPQPAPPPESVMEDTIEIACGHRTPEMTSPDPVAISRAGWRPRPGQGT